MFKDDFESYNLTELVGKFPSLASFKGEEVTKEILKEFASQLEEEVRVLGYTVIGMLIAPTCLVLFKRIETPQSSFLPVGTRVRTLVELNHVPANSFGTIVEVDTTDTKFMYEIDIEGAELANGWASENLSYWCDGTETKNWIEVLGE